MKPTPTDTKLYEYVKTLANKKFTSRSGIYRSSWIVKEYKKRGGKYIGTKSKTTGLLRWFRENWVDLNRPIKNSKGFEPCGRKRNTLKYPLCRPTNRITNKTPKTYKQISKSSIEKAKKMKQIYQHTKNVKF